MDFPESPCGSSLPGISAFARVFDALCEERERTAPAPSALIVSWRLQSLQPWLPTGLLARARSLMGERNAMPVGCDVCCPSFGTTVVRQLARTRTIGSAVAVA